MTCVKPLVIFFGGVARSVSGLQRDRVRESGPLKITKQIENRIRIPLIKGNLEFFRF